MSLLGLLCIVACRTPQAEPYDFPRPVDTTTKPIEEQSKQVYRTAMGISADNLFDGARLNNFEQIAIDSFRATILPENEPINPSPYYAFRLSSPTQQSIIVELNYPTARHRYYPKFSMDGQNWSELPSEQFSLDFDSVNAYLKLQVGPDTLWVSAQEVQNTTHLRQWCQQMAQHNDVNFNTIGQSKLGRDLYRLDIGQTPLKKKPTIVILSRQHPPEVTGWLAMRAFVEELLADHRLASDFRSRYRILVYPLMNPDGVDLGHWRHNAGGIDLNRDWAYYHQPETRQITNDIVRSLHETKSDPILGLDFHSTYRDVYYSNQESANYIDGFKDYWLMGIGDALGEEINERPSNVGQPISKNWFQAQFGTTSITYEIGDETDREYIKRKGQVSAREMMQLLVLYGTSN